MPITPAFSALVNEASAVTLARYAQIIEYDECAFFGVDPGNLDQLDCRTIWIKSERDTIAKYLAEAQLEIENQVGFFLSPRWVVGQLSDEPDGNSRLVDGGREWSLPLVTRWAEVIAGGVRAESTISAGETVSHAADPAVIGPVATTVTDPDEIRIYHPGTDIEMHPSKITISGGNVTIEIPRCRTVTEAAADNDRSGLDYSDTGPGGPFEQTVDIKRVYNSEATQAVLVFPHQCDAICAANGCAESTQDACI